VLLKVFLIAAARVVSLFAACRSLADASTDQTIRNALAATLPEMIELELQLNLALVTRTPKALRRTSRMLAIDLTLIPCHGQSAHDAKEIFRGEPKSGTTHFHAYARAVVLRISQPLAASNPTDSYTSRYKQTFCVISAHEKRR
jgi:hypothetical protein